MHFTDFMRICEGVSRHQQLQKRQQKQQMQKHNTTALGDPGPKTTGHHPHSTDGMAAAGVAAAAAAVS
jgi:hypothetical protein